MATDYSLRTLLYLPGNRREPILKAMASRPDLLVLGLDGVAPAERAAARGLVEGMVAEGALGRARVAVGIDGLDTLEVTLDLKAMVRPGVAALIVPRVELPGEIRELEAVVQDLERHAGLEIGALSFIPVLESLEALERAGEMAGASRRVVALVLGEKLAAVRGADLPEPRQARTRLALAAASAGVSAVDAPYPKVGDRQGLVGEAQRAKDMGFSGKAAIHPGQVAPIRRVFS